MITSCLDCDIESFYINARYICRTRLQYFHCSLSENRIVSLTSSIIKNIVVFSARSKFPVKLIYYIALLYLLICFWISIESLLFTEIYCNQLVEFFKVYIIKQAASSLFIFLTCINFSNVAICSCIIFYWLIKKFRPSIMTF